MQTVYEAAGGWEGMLRLASAWHARVMADEVVRHAFSHGFHPEHTERLAAYWAEALGGPTTYSDTYGDETSVVRMHSGNGPHEEMDRRAIACFDQAMADVGRSEGDPVRAVLHDYFAWATTTTMSRYHRSPDDVPDGLPIPHWSRDGLEHPHQRQQGGAMTTTPDAPMPDDSGEYADAGPTDSDEAPGAELGASDDEGSTFEPEEDPDGHGGVGR